MTDTPTTAIAYGNDRQELPLPRTTVELRVREPRRQMTVELFTRQLRAVLRSMPLDLTAPVLAITDKTRLCGYPIYLPALLATLGEMGMADGALRIVIAYGTHPRQSDGESLAAYGDSYRRTRFIHHDCRDRRAFVDLGTTSFGTPIRHRRDLLEASALFTMGPVCHHYFAGYGGGRKLVFPGCGELAAIYANHALYLDQQLGSLAKRCQPGILRGNPLAEDLFEIENARPADLAIHGILDSTGEVADFVFGSRREDFLSACRIHAASCEVASPQYDLVVASCGGYPKDINFIQSHKAIHNSAMFVKDGGRLLVYSECADGIGSTTFLPWFRHGSFADAFAAMTKRYEGNGGTALAMMTKTARLRVSMVTSLDHQTCQTMGVEKLSHLQAGQLLACQPPGTSLAYIANGGLLVRKT